MKITGIDQTSYASSLNRDSIVQGQLRAQVRALGASTGRKLVVVRDAATQRFVVQVLDPGTSTIVDQFPAESILKQMSQSE